MFGDYFNQLQPVMDNAMYLGPGTSELSIQGYAGYQTFDYVLILKTIMQQSGDVQHIFRDMLNNFANGLVMEEDYNFLRTRYHK